MNECRHIPRFRHLTPKCRLQHLAALVDVGTERVKHVLPSCHFVAELAAVCLYTVVRLLPEELEFQYVTHQVLRVGVWSPKVSNSRFGVPQKIRTPHP